MILLPKGETHIMHDFETMSLEPNAAIVSIGAVAFTREGIVDTFRAKITLRSCVELGLHIDPGTVMWWMQQSEAARTDITTGNVSLPEAIHEYLKWMKQYSPVGIWANGSMADNVWFMSALKVASTPSVYEDLIGYRIFKCYKTVRDANKDIPEPAFDGVRHTALADARHQAQHLININACLEGLYDDDDGRLL